MALTRARVVSSTGDFGNRVEGAIREVLAKDIDFAALRASGAV